MSKDNLGDRMKQYENAFRLYFPRRMPIIIRVDGRAFHTLTRGFERPFDRLLMGVMQHTAKTLCEQVSGCKLAYVQSDEISLLLTNDDCIDTEPWFGNNLQKLVSLTASIATLEFNKELSSRFFSLETHPDDYDPRSTPHFKALDKATFDSRAFLIPDDEVANYFIWRQQDASRNSVQMVARSLYSHKELTGKKTADLHDLLMAKGVNWNDYPAACKRGCCVIQKEVPLENGAMRKKWFVDQETPIFTQDREYIESRFPAEKLQK